MAERLKIRSGGALDFLSLGALVHRLDPGVIPFRKASECRIHVSGGDGFASGLFVTYESPAGPPFTEEKTYTLDAGENLSRIDVRYRGIRPGAGEMAVGLVKRAHASCRVDTGEGWMSLWGPVDDTSSHGMLGTGVVIPAGSVRGVREDSVHHLLVAALAAGNGLTYYAGAGWTRSGDVDTEEAGSAPWPRSPGPGAIRLSCGSRRSTWPQSPARAGWSPRLR